MPLETVPNTPAGAPLPTDAPEVPSLDTGVRSILKSKDRMVKQPIATRWGFASQNRYSTPNATVSKTSRTASAGDFDPGLYGDVGYDVLDSKQ